MATAELSEKLDLDHPALSVAPPMRRGQLRAFRYAMERSAAMLPMWMGQGKSRVAVEVIQNADMRRNLIVCPASVLGVWRREFRKWQAVEHDVLILEDGTSQAKAAKLIASLTTQKHDGRRLVVVVNYESVWRDKLGLLIAGTRWDSVVCDEIHRIKAPGSKQSKFIGRLRPLAGKRLGLTGTPFPHSPLDIYAQYRFLDHTVYGTSFVDFRAKYAVTDPMYPSRVLKFVRQEELSERFYKIAFRPDPDDLVDLPSVTHQTRSVVLSAAARRLYAQLEDELIADCGKGTISVPNALVKLLRLQQITSGYVPTADPDGGESVVFLGDWKAQSLKDLLEDLPTTEPVVVFCRFRNDLDAVMQVAADTGRRYGELSGRRKDLTPDGTMPANIDLYAAQHRSGGVGVDLTRAAYGVFWNAQWSLGEYDQSVCRLHRPGQTRPVLFFHLVAEGTVDRAVYGALKNRREIVEAVLNFIAKGEMDGSDDDWQP